jgi:5'-nucleotidase
MTSPSEPIHVDRMTHDFMEGCVVKGYPADCIRLALKGLNLFEGTQPLVLAGINPGANVGMDIFYSGTVAAAREALSFGCPAIAMSQLLYKAEPNNWDQTLEWAVTVLERLSPFVEEKAPAIWNINFPRSTAKVETPPIRVVPMSTDPMAVSYFPPANGDRCYTFNGSYFDRPATRGTDVSELFAGRITVTPLGLDHTLHEFLE